MSDVHMKIGVIGAGLIGGSIIKRLVSSRSIVNQIDIIVWNHNNRLDETFDKMNVDHVNSIEELLTRQYMGELSDHKSFDLIIVATPIHTIPEIFKKISEHINAISTYFEYNTILIDIASVKSSVLENAIEHNLTQNYIGTHPLFGTEFTGFENSNANMGDYATWAICHEGSTDGKKLKWLENFISQHLAGFTTLTNASDHDRVLALTSHLPHVLAYVLAGILSSQKTKSQNKLINKLNAGSFHGATRVAHGNTVLFKDMLFDNSQNIAELLKDVVGDLNELINVLESGLDYKKTKSIHHFVAKSDEFRKSISNKSDYKPLHTHRADGWVKCQCGKEHWGLNGAAGLFLVKVDEQNRVSHILLQHRALWSAEGGTWGTPGGAIEFDENPIEGALREANEEAGINGEDLIILGEITRDHKDWRFTTVLAIQKEGVDIEPKLVDQESLAVEWVSIEKVRKLPLLTAFGRELDELIERVEESITLR